MKKLILIFFFFIYLQSSAQSEFTFDELLDIEVASSSDFETKVLNKGYQFNSVDNLYFYVNSNEEVTLLTNRFASGNYYGFVYTTYSKAEYLKIKNRMIEMKFKFLKTVTIDKTDNEGLLFNANNIYITLYTVTKNFIPIYNISVQLNLLDVK